jgi:L-ascorbate metabolism protein UlaG (beta-lactamase superfamily)
VATIRFLGHAAFDVTLKGLDGGVKRVLFDPWLENPLSPVKPSDYRSAVVDYIVVTHDHGDHMGNAVELAKLTRAKVVGVYEVAENAREQGVEAVGGNVGGPLAVSDLEIVLVPAVHSSSRGIPVGAVVRGADACIYHAGDTGLFGDMALIGELYQPDVALLPIGGHFTMGVREAAKAVSLIRPKVCVPMHYNTFPLIRADPDEFKRLVESMTRTRVVVLKPGESFEFP